MKRLIEVPLDAGQVAVFEVEDEADGIVRSARPSEVIGRMTESFAAGIRPFRTIAESILDTFGNLSEQPDEVAVEFGIKAIASAGLVVAQTSGEATFTVTLRWQQQRHD